MNYIVIISILVIIILFLLYVTASNKGWNCTENGCDYVSGGYFNSYKKCNSHCKSSNSCRMMRHPFYSRPMMRHPFYSRPIMHYPPRNNLYYQEGEKRKKSEKIINENNIVINSKKVPIKN